MTDYDVVVIGAGPGGYVCAIRAAQLGKKTAIIDRQWLGGVCLNVGCIPSKALLRNAEIAHLLRHGGKDFGFEVQGLKLDYGAAVKRSRQVADRLVKGVGFLMKKNKIDVVMGAAAFVDAHTVEVTAADGAKSTLQAKDVVIATGASPMLLPGVQADGPALTYLDGSCRSGQSVVVIAGYRLRVARCGTVRGRGHADRDAVAWRRWR
jgi:dihydrolipoamide dehydrogenase